MTQWFDVWHCDAVTVTPWCFNCDTVTMQLKRYTAAAASPGAAALKLLDLPHWTPMKTSEIKEKIINKNKCKAILKYFKCYVI